MASPAFSNPCDSSPLRRTLGWVRGGAGPGRQCSTCSRERQALCFFRCLVSASNPGRGGASGREGVSRAGRRLTWRGRSGRRGRGRGSCSVGLAAAGVLGAASRLGAAVADAGSVWDAWRWRLWRYARERERAPACCPLSGTARAGRRCAPCWSKV